jgi:hypothetical protein
MGTLARVLDALGLLSELDHLLEAQRDPGVVQFALQRLKK